MASPGNCNLKLSMLVIRFAGRSFIPKGWKLPGEPDWRPGGREAVDWVGVDLAGRRPVSLTSYNVYYDKYEDLETST